MENSLFEREHAGPKFDHGWNNMQTTITQLLFAFHSIPDLSFHLDPLLRSLLLQDILAAEEATWQAM